MPQAPDLHPGVTTADVLNSSDVARILHALREASVPSSIANLVPVNIATSVTVGNTAVDDTAINDTAVDVDDTVVNDTG